jgi:hypothetical protein
MACQEEPKKISHTYKVYVPLVVNIQSPASKKGIGLTYSNCNDVGMLGVYWYYDWSLQPPICDPDTEVIPMIFDSSAIGATIKGRSDWLMGFNEPDLLGVTPSVAATQWRRVEQLYQKKLVAPVPSQNNPVWLEQTRNAYIAQYGVPPKWDALAVHCYEYFERDCRTKLQGWFNKLQDWNIPELWITEFSFFPCNGHDAPNEMKSFVNYLNSEPRVTRYAWFAARIRGDEAWSFGAECNPASVDGLGNLTPLGRAYR